MPRSSIAWTSLSGTDGDTSLLPKNWTNILVEVLIVKK
jgi:hypothetical protein